MALEVKEISWWDTLRLHVFVTAVATFWGSVAPNRRFVPLLSRWDAGRRTARFLDDLRQKYQCEHLWLWFPGGRTLLVLDPRSIDAALLSKDNFADPPLKRNALSKSMPDALTMSAGDEWLDRRRFNEAVLDSGHLHHHHDAFREVVFRAVDRFAAQDTGEWRWADFHALAQAVSHQILFGPGRIEPEMTRQLARMVVRSNWPFLPRDGRSFSGFYERVERYLAGNRQVDGEPLAPRCLVHESVRLLESGGATAVTQVPGQIGFWFFVLQDALELHVARTLALIAAHPEVQDRARAEIRAVPALTGLAIDGLRYLDGCIDEQLRLWTPVPILLRRAASAFSLRGEIAIEPGQQILMHTGHYHRDARVFGERADRFSPGSGDSASAPVYFFSGHRQVCAGQSLAKFLLKATLAALLERFRFEWVGPAMAPGRIPHTVDHYKIRLRPVRDAQSRVDKAVP